MAGTVTSCPRCGFETQEGWTFCPRCAMVLDSSSFDVDTFSDRIQYVRREAEKRINRSVVLRSLPNLVWGVVVLVVIGGGFILFHPSMVPSLFEQQEFSVPLLEEPAAAGPQRDTDSPESPIMPFEWVPVPAGEYSSGPTPKEDGDPLPLVYVPAFEIMKYEVTNGQWFQYLRSEEVRLRKLRRFESSVPRPWKDDSSSDVPPPPSGVPIPPESLYEKPVVFISWESAKDFCEMWLAHQPGCSGARLPTSLEWEKAARGPDDERPFPWGDSFTSYDSISGSERYRCNVMETGINEVLPVWQYSDTDVSPYGVIGMGGNVAEYVGDPGSHGYRGGTFNTDQFSARIWEEWPVDPNRGFTWSFVGFRAARSLK